MSNPWSQAYEDLRKPYLEGKMAKKDYDGDGKVESGTDEYMGSKDKAIKKAMGKKVAKEHHQKDADGKVIEHEDTTPSSVEEGQINEVSKKTLGSYVKKASTEIGTSAIKGDYKKMQKRHKGVLDASDKLTKEEVVNEKKMVKVKIKDPSKIKVKVTDIGAGGKEYVRKNEMDEMITLTKGDYASRNVVGSAYNTAAKKKFDSKIYKAGGGLGSNFLPLANSQEPEGDMIEAKEGKVATGPRLGELRAKGATHPNAGQGEKIVARTKKYMDKKGMKGAPGLDSMKARTAEHKAKRGMKKEKMVKKESFSDWRSEFVWEDGDSIKKT